MTPTETITILRRYNKWRRGNLDDQPMPDPREIGEVIDAAVEMIERLEAAEKAVTEAYQRGYETGQEEIEKERAALRAKIEAMERQEPVAWYSKQDDFVYMSRPPSQFEHGSILYLRNGAPAWRIEGSSKTALLDIASLPHGTVFYTLPGAQPAPSVPDGWKLVPTEPTKEMRAAWDSSPICEDDDAEFRRAYSEMLAAAPEAKP